MTDTDRLARFEREAKLLASLNHSNIAAIYGLEEHAGSRFLVLELVEGDTLADRIGQGAIPLDEALEIAHQIADMAPDGRALVTVLADPDSVADDHHLVFMQNFLDEVRRRVPAP